MAAGLDKNARCIDALAAMGFGFVEVGTVTPRPQPGNPKPRMFRIPEKNALINRLGFNNEGLDAFLANASLASACKSRKQWRRHAAGPEHRQERHNPHRRGTSDYIKALDGVYPHADYVTVNISSPNTKNLRACKATKRWMLCWVICQSPRTAFQPAWQAHAGVREDRSRPR
jgi:dihydroorotate dehydrogenase